MAELEASINILMSKHSDLTDSIYGIIQYIKEQSHK